jgi:transducin (beta)-like 1
VLDYAPPPTADGAAADGEAKMSRDITTLEWSPDGALLATGCMDGCARVWNDAGELKHTLSRHSESIFSLRFDPTGAHLLTGSYDKTVAVWDVNSGSLVKRFESHSAQVLDVDWQDASTFASCSTDKTIAVYTLGNDAPIGRFGGTAQGHADEVNAIRWDHGSGGGLLASCSDDHTAKLWKTDRGCVQTLGEHSKEIYTVRWRPKGSTAGAGGSMLATASFDTTVRLWDAETATAVHTLRAHDKKVYTVAFSPDGKFLASGSLGGQLHIWNVADGALVRSFFCDSDIFEVAWNAAGTRVAATSTNAITVIDIRVV